MRKRNCKNLFDNIMWYTIYLLPIIITLLIVGGAFQGDWFNVWYESDGDMTNLPFFYILHSVIRVGFEMTDFNIVVDVFNAIFSVESGLIPVFASGSVVILYLSYFVFVYLFHLMVDFLLFIPRLAHKWLNSFTRSDD